MSPRIDDNAIRTNEGNPSRMSLSRICLDIQRQADRYRPVFEAFLRRQRDALDLGAVDDLVGAYLERVWPNGFPGTMIVANIAMDGFGRWLIRPSAEGPLAASFAMLGPDNMA